MEDRTPTPGQEGRVLITPENGSAPFYAKVTMADNPTNPGTPLTKKTLLQDSTEIEIFGNASNRTVDEAFSGIMDRIDLIMQNVASMALTITDTAGNPIPGVYVNGVFDDDGNAIKTNASGQINGYVAEGDSTLSITSYADITPYSEVFTAVKGQSYTKTIQVTTRNFLQILSSARYRFSENVTQLDVNPVGGGEGGGKAYDNSSNIISGPGGNGGRSIIYENVDFQTNTLYQAIVGSGGVKSSTSTKNSGGDSSFVNVVAQGGSASVSNGSGGNSVTVRKRNGNVSNGRNGSAGTDQMFASFTELTSSGGGGGSGGACYGYADSGQGIGGSGGDPSGGRGGDGGYQESKDAEPGKVPGGGGGGGGLFISTDNYLTFSEPSNGANGCINIRMHLTTAA